MSVECGYCGNKIHDENCPKYPYCQGCKKGRGRSDHEAECIYAYTLPKQKKSKEWFRSKIELEQGETVSAGSLTELDLEQIKEDMMRLAGISVRPWGHQKIIYSDEICMVKKLFVKRGHRLSLQYHQKKIESMTLIDGEGYIQLGDKEAVTFRMNKFIPVLIEPYKTHRLAASLETDCLIIEISSAGHEEDIVRIQDDYGR